MFNVNSVNPARHKEIFSAPTIPVPLPSANCGLSVLSPKTLNSYVLC
jgi:hypothetical protein